MSKQTLRVGVLSNFRDNLTYIIYDLTIIYYINCSKGKWVVKMMFFCSNSMKLQFCKKKNYWHASLVREWNLYNHKSFCEEFFLWNIFSSNFFLTVDEIWIHNFTPDIKEKSKHWRYHGSTHSKKTKTAHSAGKTIVSVKFFVLITFSRAKL